MSARAWRARKPGQHSDEHRASKAWAKALSRAQRCPGEPVRVSGTPHVVIADEVDRMQGVCTGGSLLDGCSAFVHRTDCAQHVGPW